MVLVTLPHTGSVRSRCVFVVALVHVTLVINDDIVDLSVTAFYSHLQLFTAI